MHPILKRQSQCPRRLRCRIQTLHPEDKLSFRTLGPWLDTISLLAISGPRSASEHGSDVCRSTSPTVSLACTERMQRRGWCAAGGRRNQRLSEETLAEWCPPHPSGCRKVASLTNAESGHHGAASLTFQSLQYRENNTCTMMSCTPLLYHLGTQTPVLLSTKLRSRDLLRLELYPSATTSRSKD